MRTISQDDLIINLDQDWQCRWWSRQLGVESEALRKAIREAGPLARNVRRHLKAMQETSDANALRSTSGSSS